MPGSFIYRLRGVIVRRMPESFVCQQCGEAGRKKQARGLCVRCYSAVQRAYRNGGAAGRQAVCTRCGERRMHYAKGLCHRCHRLAERDRNAEAYRARARAWYAEHTDRGRANNRRNYHTDPERHKAEAAAWAKAHPLAAAVHGNRKRALRRGAAATLTEAEWLAILDRYDWRCAYCGAGLRGRGRTTQDHVLPLSRGGAHEAGNVVPACRRCNSAKHDLTGAEYLERLRRGTFVA